ncbi:hypothetical protein L6452_34186 [Arctium lappa]|uniref:Uncharacterized protein n=1 Tax=Arctium lappa TaxID=4217 RepID=A0ACB8YIN8_ARCLA|nr:hypothetical protein L6452_34186 [Arctium lappa]
MQSWNDQKSFCEVVKEGSGRPVVEDRIIKKVDAGEEEEKGQPLFWDDCEVSSEEEGDDSSIPSESLEKVEDDEEWTSKRIINGTESHRETGPTMEHQQEEDHKSLSANSKSLLAYEETFGSSTENEETCATTFGEEGNHEVKQVKVGPNSEQGPKESYG